MPIFNGQIRDIPEPHLTFYLILQQLWLLGKECAPRGLKVRELIDFHYTLPPRVRFMCFDARKLNLDYIKQEFMWYCRGDNKDVSIKHIAKMWDSLINQDGTINSNYGHYLFSSSAGKNQGYSNFKRAASELIKDPDSRRATICILSNDHLNSDTKDYPCTSYINFHIRENKLIMYVRMRSQDAIFGMGNDAPCFSFIHEMMYTVLKVIYKDLQMGNYHHTADSFHVYERHYEMVEKILHEPFVSVDYHEACPSMVDLDIGILPYISSPHHISRYKNNPNSPFITWILARDNTETLVNPEHV